MLISTKQKLYKLPKSTLDLSINDVTLANVEKQKLLGVEIDSNLEYTVHIDKRCKNISSKLALLKRIKRYLTIDYRKIFYNGYILPLIDYYIVVWSNTSKSNLSRIHRLQKYAVRIILDALFNELNWLNIFEKIDYQKSLGLILYKMKYEPSPSYLHDLFPVPNSTSHLLRSNTLNNFDIPRPNTEKGPRSYLCTEDFST